MSLPTKVKNWQITENVSVPPQGTELLRNQHFLKTIKDTLVGFANNPWSVISSSNTTTADANDNWNAPADLIWSSGSTRSWIVLGNVDGFEMLIDLKRSNSDSHTAAVYIAAGGGFTGGTTTAAPTAPGQYAMGTSINWISSNSTATFQGYVQAWHSDDGKQTWVACNGLSANLGVWHIGTPSNVASGWTTPFVFAMTNATSSAPSKYKDGLFEGGTETVANFLGADTWTKIFGYTLHRFEQTTYATQLQPSVSPVSGNFPLLPIWVGGSPNIGTEFGVHCILDDIYLINETAAADGDTLPAAGPTEWVKINDYILPWTGATMLFG